MIKSILVAVMASSMMPAAFALTPAEQKECRAQWQSLKGRKDKVAMADAARKAAARRAEALGETWENAEALRDFSPRHASAADKALSEYEAAKTDFEQKNAKHADMAQAFNADAIAFSEKCAKD